MGKLGKLRNLFDDLGINGILIVSDLNRQYLTNFTGSFGVVLISKTEAKLITDFRYVEQACSQAQDFEIIQFEETLFEEVAKQAEKIGITKLGFEGDHMTYNLLNKYKEHLNSELVPTSNIIENFRMIKTEDEISKLKRAAEIGDAAFAHILQFIRPGLTERDIANELEFYMRKIGAKSASNDIIVASGYRSAIPHGRASNKVIEKGDLVTLDYGALYEGYRSDMTRTVAIGEPDEELKKIYNIVLEAQERCANALKPGMPMVEADALTRDFIREKGYGEFYGHGTGHGIGLDLHEGPTLNPKSVQVLETGMVVTVEPGIYIPNLGGVRIEDDVLITEDSHEILTHSPKNLIIL